MNPPADTAEHIVDVHGVWHNDSTAGVGLWCQTCQKFLYVTEDDSSPEVTSIAALTAAIAAHRTERFL